MYQVLETSKIKLSVAYYAIIIFLFSGIHTPSYSQAPLVKPTTTIIPPSPDAASLGEYGQYVLGPASGIPSIDIPLGTLKGKGLEVPLSVSYNASGIKVDEIASWIGLGWDLNAGGVITRSVVGLHDDYGGYGFYNATPKHYADIQDTQADWDYLLLASQGDVDTESDYYFFNFLGRAGKFTLDDNKQAFQIPASPLKIDLSGYPLSITIVDEKGVIYLFEDRETMSNTTYFQGGSQRDFTFISSWYLSEIHSPSTDEVIHFSYSQEIAYVDSNVTDTETIGDKYIIDPYIGITLEQKQRDISSIQVSRMIRPLRLSNITSTLGKVEFVSGSGRLDLPETRLSQVKFYARNNSGFELLKSFEFNNAGHFSYNNGSTIDPNSPSQHRLKLSGLTEKDALGGSEKIHTFTYNNTLLPPKGSDAQDHWGYFNGQTTNTSLVPSQVVNFQGYQYNVGNGNRDPSESHMKACVLEKIDYPTGGSTTFSFEGNRSSSYSETKINKVASAKEIGNTTTLITANVSFTPTTSGFAKLVVTCSNVTDPQPYFSEVHLVDVGYSSTLIDHVYAPYGGSFDAEQTKTYNVYLEAGRQYTLSASAMGNSTSTQSGGAAYSIGTITYSEVVNGVYSLAGGLRVASITSDPEDTGNPIVKSYKYGPGEAGFGYLISPLKGNSYSGVKTHRLGYTTQGVTCLYVQTDRQSFFSSTSHPLESLNGSSVVYSHIIEYVGTETINSGKILTEFMYSLSSGYPVPQQHQEGSLPLYDSWRKALPSVLTNKDSNGNNKMKNEYGYSSQQLQSIKRFVVGDLYAHAGCRTPSSVYSDFYWFDYSITTGILLPRSDKTTYFDTSGNYSVSSVKSYDDYQQLVAIDRENSDGKLHSTKIKYPQNYPHSGIIGGMQDRNMFGVPVEVISSVDAQVINAEARLFNYNSIDQDIVSTDYYIYEPFIGSPAFQESTNGFTFSGYTHKSSIEYDASGNITSLLTDDNIPVSYCWAYKNGLPVVKAENIDYLTLKSAVQSAAGTSDLETFWWGFVNVTSASTLWNTFNTNLRNNANLVNAQITTYTYDPDVGITSQTDPNGQTTYYTYDALGRLILVSDFEGNPIAKTDYHYSE